MTFHQFNRRLHLYLALLLLPCVVMYGVSSFVINHMRFFQKPYDDGVPQWSVRIDRPYNYAVPENADAREIGAQILADIGLEGPFDVRSSNPRRLQFFLNDFWSIRRVTFDVDKRQIRVEDRRFQWNQFAVWMHERSGFHRDSLLHDAWAIMVDLTCIGFIIFIASGLFMWWQLKQARLWGVIALGAGVTSFVVFLLTL